MSQAGIIDAGALLHELDETWRSIGKPEGGVLRACSMTIVTLARPGDDPQELGGIIADLMHDYPCRAIVLRLGGEAGEPSGRATVQCWMPHGSRQQICSEEIDLHSPFRRAGQIAAVLRGLLVPDLPVVFWCRDLALAAHPDLQSLYPLAGRIIVDSVPIREARDAFAAITELRRHGKPVSDLAWTRVTRWRALLENVFQTPLCRRKLRDASRAFISWSGTGTPAVACYLGAWLKSHLPGLQLELACEAPEFPPPGTGRIRRLRLESGEFSVELHRPSGTQVNVHGLGVESSLVFPLFSESDVLREELALPGIDPRFEAAWPEVMRLA